MRSRRVRAATLSLARRVVRAYPQPWRDRYEDEMLALLEDCPPRLRDLVDLARGLVVERIRAMFEPGDRPRLAAAVLGVSWWVAGVAVMFLPFGAGVAAHAWVDAPRRAGVVGDLLTACVMWSFIVQLGRTSRHGRAPLTPVFSSRSGLVWIGSILAAVFLQTWESPSASRIPHILLLASLVAQQLGMPRAWRTIVSAVIRSGQVQREMKWARMELARCERVIARGGAAPLQEARDAVLRLMREQRGTLNLLQGFGYRAGLAGRCSHRTAGGDAAEPS